jgi:hypothetical protein
MTQDDLVKAIKSLIEKGDKYKDKAEQSYISAGLHLKTLKAEHKGTWAEWEKILKEKCGIGKSRASELMRIADGTTTVEQVRSDTAKRVMKHSEAVCPLANGESRKPAVAANVFPASVGPEVPARQELERVWDAAPPEAKRDFVDTNLAELKDLIAQHRKRAVDTIAERVSPAIKEVLVPVASDPGEIPGFLRRVPQ